LLRGQAGEGLVVHDDDKRSRPQIEISGDVRRDFGVAVAMDGRQLVIERVQSIQRRLGRNEPRSRAEGLQGFLGELASRVTDDLAVEVRRSGKGLVDAHDLAHRPRKHCNTCKANRTDVLQHS
jgi:hypothetical protein